MSHLDPIYAVWDGNAEAMATDIGEPGVKVRQWRNRQNIPSDYWPRIIEVASKRGVALKWQQFIRDAVSDASAPEVEDDVAAHRVAMCGVCERRSDDPALRGCTAVDCPHNARDISTDRPADACAAGFVDDQRMAA